LILQGPPAMPLILPPETSGCLVTMLSNISLCPTLAWAWTGMLETSLIELASNFWGKLLLISPSALQIDLESRARVISF
jgi:hypothetical protein